jgi:hypothetical protein
MAVLFRSTAAESMSTPAHLRVVLARSGDALELRIPKRRGPPLVSPIRLHLRASTRIAIAERSVAPEPVRATADPARPLPRIAA